MHALLAASLCIRLPDQRYVQDHRWAGDLAIQQMYGLPVLHGRVPVRDPKI
jgi:hypothetical protein